MHRIAVVAVALAAGLAQVPAPHPTWPADAAPVELAAFVQRGELLILEVRGALLGELMRGLQSSGESGAMRSCHLDAIAVTQRIGRQTGVAVGRTADRLRNPTNVPPRWAAPLVAKHAGARAAGVPRYVVDLGDHVGVLEPITTGQMCLGCHGPANRLGAGVRAELKERYPADRAVGFGEGDLRGWFWVEVPRNP